MYGCLLIENQARHRQADRWRRFRVLNRSGTHIHRPLAALRMVRLVVLLYNMYEQGLTLLSSFAYCDPKVKGIKKTD